MDISEIESENNENYLYQTAYIKDFDVVVSNNGINNVKDLEQPLKECSRLAKPNAQMFLTLNLDETMIEFYNAFQETLLEKNLSDAGAKIKQQIYGRRKSLAEIKTLLVNSGFVIKKFYRTLLV